MRRRASRTISTPNVHAVSTFPAGGGGARGDDQPRLPEAVVVHGRAGKASLTQHRRHRLRLLAAGRLRACRQAGM